MLSVDMVEAANSGHPGMPLGAADIATVLFAKFLKFNAKNPKWFNRDRFILSAGHGSAMLYSLLYLTGYEDISLEDLKNFRQLGSKTAGHPEYGHLAGVEITTGPLGQGIANGVGMAISERIYNARYGEVVNHKTFVLCGDGCLMEGISHEALTLAGHLKLKNLIVIYDKNDITIDGKLSLSDSVNSKMRFESYGFNVFECDGHNYEEIEIALKGATLEQNDKPSIVIAQTKIGFGSTVEGSEKSHGSPLGSENLKLLREALNWKYDPFEVPSDLLSRWRSVGSRHACDEFSPAGIDLNEFKRYISEYKSAVAQKQEKKATRQHFADLMSEIQKHTDCFIGGSADLSGSNGTKTSLTKAISAADFGGNYIHYGIREHAMGAIMNGITVHGGLIPFGGTFLVFADYMRPAIRLSALMRLRVIYVLTHDSIAVGEDGPTHQPIEHLASLRAIPNLNVFRPCDAIELTECFEIAVESRQTPSCIVLTRQALTPIRHNGQDDNKSEFGAYFIKKDNHEDNAQIVMFASGSEVQLATKVATKLIDAGLATSVVSIPCLELFKQQSSEYRNEILNSGEMRVFIEAGIRQSYDKYIRDADLAITVETFGESGKGDALMEKFGLTVEQVFLEIKNKFIKNRDRTN